MEDRTLPHQPSVFPTAAPAPLFDTALKRHSFTVHADDRKLLDPLMISAAPISAKPVASEYDKSSRTLPHKRLLSTGSRVGHSKMDVVSHPLTAHSLDTVERLEPLLVSCVSSHQEITGVSGCEKRSSYTLPQPTSSSGSTAFQSTGRKTKRQSDLDHRDDSPDKLKPLLASSSSVGQDEDTGSRLGDASGGRMFDTYITSLQHPGEGTVNTELGSASSTSMNSHPQKPVLMPDSLSTQQRLETEGNRAYATLPPHVSGVPVSPRQHSMMDKHLSMSSPVNVQGYPQSDFVAGTSTNKTSPREDTSSAVLPHQSSSPVAAQHATPIKDIHPLAGQRLDSGEHLEPLVTSRSPSAADAAAADSQSVRSCEHRTSASYSTLLHYQEMTGETHPSPTHTAELMLAGGLPKNRRRPGASPDSGQHVTMRGTITRGNSVGQPVKVQLELTETEFHRLTSYEPLKKEDFKYKCGRYHGPHIILWSLLCIPVAIAISLSVAFYNGSMTWYNLVIYFSEERTVVHRVALCPLIILTFPLTVGISAAVISLVAAAMQVSWSWQRWLAEICDGEKGFYGWFCGKIGLPKCSPYQVVVLDSSGAQPVTMA